LTIRTAVAFPVGLVTDRDLVVRVLSDGARDIDALVLADAMTSEPSPLGKRRGVSPWRLKIERRLDGCSPAT
jgi:hypothetical protein